MEATGPHGLFRRIGDYLIDEKICDEHAIAKALDQQASLKSKGVFKPLGSLVIEDLGLEVTELNRVLRRMHIDVLATSLLFKDLAPESIGKTIAVAEQRILPENYLIYNKGEQADMFFVVLSGRVKVFLPAGDGADRTLAVLGNGECFGEMALLTGEARSTSVKTIEPTNLLVLTKTYFDQLCSLYSGLYPAIYKSMAGRLRQGYDEIASATENERAYQQLICQHSELSLPDLIGQTKIINQLRKKIVDASGNDWPILIQGEPGTEKLVVAGAIHKGSQRTVAPFLTMDAGDVSIEGYGAAALDSSDLFHIEMAQSSVLFGHEQGAFPFAKARRIGLLQIGREGTVVIENIDKLTPAVQQQLLEFINTRSFQPVGGKVTISSAARIMATESTDLARLVEEGKFDQQLYEALAGNSMLVPPVRKRKGDLRLLVDFLIIMECFKGQDRKLIKGISDDAYQRIMEYDWPGNMDELEVVIRRAINLAQTDYLMPEDVFIGMAPPEGKYTFNLLQLDKVRQVFKSRAFPVAIQAATGSVFGIIFLLAFFGSQSPDRNVSVLMVWAMWWPMLTVSWIVGARIWCTVCPMGAINDLLNRFCSLKRKVPKFIRDNGIYLSAVGLGGIIWVEAASGMPYSPMATGFLLLAIASFAMLSGFIFERRVWCRYLCPLGRLAAIFSGCSVIEWRSNSSICNSTCKTNSCYKGTAEVAGCPVYQGPFSLRSNQDCILCGNCVKICENASPAFNLRIPGHELWAALKPESVTAIFVPVILGTQVFRGLEHTALTHALETGLHSRWAAYALLLLVATGLAYGFARLAGAMAFGPLKDVTVRKDELFVNAIIPLAFVFELGFQLDPLLERLGQFFPVLGRQLGLDFEFLDFAGTAGAAKPWQVFFILLGMLVSWIFLRILIGNHQEVQGGGIRYKRLRHVPILVLGAAYIWMFVGK